jgi:hypothetical protein
MGKLDTMTKEYMSDTGHFADAFNYYIFQGREVIDNKNLSVLDTAEIGLVFDNESSEIVQKVRDVLKQCVLMEDEKMSYLLLGIENQSDVHYAMPVKNMIYDALNYGRQVAELAKRNREQKLAANKAEFLSGMLKKDRIKPVITLTIYFGADDWGGPRCLKDMFGDVSEEVLRYVDDYRLHLIVPKEIEDFKLFKSDFGKVMHFIAVSKSKEGMASLKDDEDFRSVGNDTIRLINECTNTNIRIDEEKGVTDVCQGLQELLLDEREEGLEKGLEQGLEQGLERGHMDMIQRLMKKGKSKEEIIDLLEVSEEEYKKAEEDLCVTV